MRYFKFKGLLTLVVAVALLALGSWYYYTQMQKTDTEPEKADLVMAYSSTR